MAAGRAKVLDVGQCNPDHAMLKALVQRYFEADVDRVMFVEEALQAMRGQRYHLVMVNRLIFEDGSDGTELIRRARQTSELADVPIMLISNHAEAQQRALAAGGVEGFGKDDLRKDLPRTRLSAYLPARSGRADE